MVYYTIIENGYIVSLGTYNGTLTSQVATVVTESEYNAIRNAYANKPEETETIGYRLKTDLTWEPYEKEPIPEPEPDAEEILEILTGETE